VWFGSLVIFFQGVHVTEFTGPSPDRHGDGDGIFIGVLIFKRPAARARTVRRCSPRSD
jgi:hypothetical protein